jgi:glycosyltransferase involved in cell wall biosynthesis
LYPTNSLNRITFLFDAYALGKKIIFENNFTKGQSVITVQDPMTIVGYALSKKFCFPLQIQIHTDIFSLHFKKSNMGFKKFWYGGFIQTILANFFVKRAQSVRVVSNNLKESIISKFPHLKNKVDVLPVYVDVLSLANTYPGRDIKKDFPRWSHIVLMASRLSSEKRIDTALKVLKKVLIKFPLAGLVICGEGEEDKNLKCVVAELNLGQNVAFLPWQKDLASYYKTADIFLSTSEYEGYGMTMIEAGASGCAMVVTKVGIASSEIFKNNENCFVCEVGDISCLSQGVVELLSNNSKRDDFRRKMQSYVVSISKSKEEYVIEYVRLLENLLKQND